MLTDGGDVIWLEVEYSTDLFGEERIDRMVGHFLTILDGAAANSAQPLAELPLLTAAERDQLLIGWNEVGAEQWAQG